MVPVGVTTFVVTKLGLLEQLNWPSELPCKLGLADQIE
jgi:hypothetical protein